MSGLDWLTSQPVAHRGLHDSAAGVIENTPAAFKAAIGDHYAIECDLQISADGEAMVHHDDVLGRLTDGAGRLDALTAADLKRVPFKASSDRMLTLGELCDLVGGRVPLVIEIKSRFDGDRRTVIRAASVLESYPGPAALMSFDPAQIEALHQIAPRIPRGIIAERHYGHHEWDGLAPQTKRSLAFLSHARESRPQFVAYSVKDLGSAVAFGVHKALGLPLLTWTVRSDEDRRRSARWADQMIFEGFRP